MRITLTDSEAWLLYRLVKSTLRDTQAAQRYFNFKVIQSSSLWEELNKELLLLDSITQKLDQTLEKVFSEGFTVQEQVVINPPKDPLP
jgi:hypothetical protein